MFYFKICEYKQINNNRLLSLSATCDVRKLDKCTSWNFGVPYEARNKLSFLASVYAQPNLISEMAKGLAKAILGSMSL